MPPLIQHAPAKVNLFLHIGDKRADGYHDLTSLVVFPDVGDEIAGEAQTELELAIVGPFAKTLNEEEGRLIAPLAPAGHAPQHAAGRMTNLVLRAAQALRHQALAMGRPVAGAKIVLTKNLPIASGIGGGSADAAATIRILNELWALNLPVDTLRAVGLTLGSDVPVCIASAPQWMEGRGEHVSPGPTLPAMAMVLVNPGVAVPTAPVFQALKIKSGGARPVAPQAFSSARDVAAWLKAETRNDLQSPAIGIAPQISDVLQRLDAQPGCLLARMSGSGATCFGLFETDGAAARAAAAMPEAWWVKTAARV